LAVIGLRWRILRSGDLVWENHNWPLWVSWCFQDERVHDVSEMPCGMRKNMIGEKMSDGRPLLKMTENND
jgi:hypothetical protein